MKYQYLSKRFSSESMALIELSNSIIEDYKGKGLSLTLRQIYYRLVSAGEISNTVQEYKRLGTIISNGRLAGLIDWEAIEDRTRALKGNVHWDRPSQIIETYSDWYSIDKWENQPYRPEVWVEKDALVGVIQKACNPLDVDYFSCRGYSSQSEMKKAADRLLNYTNNYDQLPVIIHLGDHDPSGIDMTRDIRDRLEIFGMPTNIKRIALNMDQIEKFNPPPNPARLDDPRAKGYIAEFGNESWELDALEPDDMILLIQDTIKFFRDINLWKEARHKERDGRRELKKISRNYDKIIKELNQ